ncbi:MAG: phosphatidylserine/phosphatidylglycerophosphate/cardiolipin synthase family protein [Candidatus Calescibacterium sp.]|nr:phosphatidylserine/phosphatidylglycerophosphate/cardiolipin synthase family protein [Candidatus Calescibacterium sp.]MDW8133119.1 phosphatidylserine/phosphatidylglycerophosphate/cardiolipin synthase family protein [Candidatus Calescibacterium sp.]
MDVTGISSNYYKPGNKVEFLNSEEVTSKEVELILGAQDTIHIAKYSFNSMLISNLLAKKAKEGVKVRIVTDSLSLSGSGKEWEKRKYVIDYLRSNGVEIEIFPFVPIKEVAGSIKPMNVKSHTVDNGSEVKTENPQNPTNDYENKSQYQLMHAKFVSVDGKKAVISGVNWSDGSFKNTDAGIFVEGKVIDDLEKNFWFLFKKSGGKDYEYIPRAEEAGNSNASLLLSDKDFQKTSYSAAVYNTVKNAQNSIYISAFVLSDPYLIKLLIDAKNRGVKVKVIMDPNTSPTYSNPNYETAKKLKEAGIIPRWYKVQTYNTNLSNFLHSKMLIADNTLIVGSANFSYRGLRINHEVGIQTDDKNAVSKAIEYFKKIWKENTSTIPYLPPPPPGQNQPTYDLSNDKQMVSIYE